MLAQVLRLSQKTLSCDVSSMLLSPWIYVRYIPLLHSVYTGSSPASDDLDKLGHYTSLRRLPECHGRDSEQWDSMVLPSQ
jgi:hypothetical protein